MAFGEGDTGAIVMLAWVMGFDLRGSFPTPLTAVDAGVGWLEGGV